MFNLYLFIELLGAANPDAVIASLNRLDISECQFFNVVRLSDEKVVAQLDCATAEAGQKAVLGKIANIDGIVQTNIIAVVRPVNR